MNVKTACAVLTSTRSISTRFTGRARRRYRRRLDRIGPPEGRRQGPLDWSFELQRAADGTRTGHCSYRLAATSLCGRQARDRTGHPTLLYEAKHWRIVYSPMYAGLLTGAMTKERVANFLAEDWRSNLPDFQEPELSRNLRARRTPSGDRASPRSQSWRGGDRVDIESSRGDWGNRRVSKSAAGFWDRRRGGFPLGPE